MPRSVAFGDRLRYFPAIMSDTVLLAIDGPRATITLNDPAKHNRLDPGGLDLLMAAVETADANPDVRVTVITGAGEKSFCSGYDLGSIPASGQKPESNNGTGHKDSAFETVMDRIEAMRMPTLCALNGSVYGGATDMALACDFRLGVKGMKFFMPAARFGLERSEFKGKIDEISNRLATLAPLSMVNMKRAIEQYAQAEPDVPAIRQNMRECATSEDLREGLAALRERRAPDFKGR
jgi:enoyl-CoA hydratase